MTFKYPKVKFFYDVLDLIKSNFFFILIIFIINMNSQSTMMQIIRLLFVIFLAISLFNRVVEVFFTKVTFASDGVRVYTGVFSKSERFVPKEKFENIQTAATALQRLFGVHTITMETGDATGDVTLKFVKQDMRDKIEAYVLSENDATGISKQQEDGKDVLFTPSIQDLLKASLTSFSFLAIIPIVINAWSDLKLDKFIDVTDVMLPIWLKLLLILFAVAVALAIGILKTFNSYYQYKISMDDERIYVQKGWLSKQSFSIRKEKVQAVIYKQTWYQKLLRVTTIRLISTGEMMKSDEQQINEFFPYLPTAKADELVANMLPQFTRKDAEYTSSKKAKKLIWLKPPIFALVIALVGLWIWIFYVIACVVLVFTYLYRILAYKNLAFTLHEQHAQVTSGAWTVETIVTKRQKLIEMQFEHTLLQRKTGIMTMKLCNRAQPVHITEVKNIDNTMQKELLQWFEQRANEVQIDAKTAAGTLKKETLAQFNKALQIRAQQLENN